jgi:hypothetical protein
MSINVFNILDGLSDGHSFIPSRDPGSVSGSTFIQNNLKLDGPARELNVLHEFQHGNIPDFLRHFVAISVTDGTNSLSYLVMSDVLCIGNNSDYVRMPMNPLTAQAIATQYDCTLPTRKMSNDIWIHATNKVTPHAMPPDADMNKTYRISMHNAFVQDQLVKAGLDPHQLTSGHKKDVVLTNGLYPNNLKQKVAIYGWMMLNGQAIQPLNYVSHSVMYEDYSHGIRLVANDVLLNGQARRMQDVFADGKLSALVSDEGPLKFVKY